MKKFHMFVIAASLFSLLSSGIAYAHCPVCSAATGMAVVGARLYGIDDLVLGVFTGGFIISTALWFNNFLLKRNKGAKYLPMQKTIMVLFSFVTTIVTLYMAGLLNNTAAIYTMFGIDKLFIGSLIGTAISIVAYETHAILKSRNNDKNYLPFQSIIMVLSFLVITSALFYVIQLI
ncbi:MAG: hypothetical protein HY832_02630 [Candidatus Aenigmarchaeota archaeon]|nr:hypothetical protein [Candidatus Aenigmarchaeota archaeon]